MMGRFGLLGEYLAHSFSPLIHKEFGAYEYHLFERKPDELDEFLTRGDFDGLNITIPYKKSVIPYCQGLSETACIIGSVNTITRLADGTLNGDNTDYFGFAYLLKKAGANPSCGKTIILGSGGSSLTAQAVLKDMGARELVVVSRNTEDNYENISRHYDATTIVNTTPVGMYPNNGNSPIRDLRLFNNCQTVIDLIYNPARTELVLQAEEQGIRCENGLAMLVAQAKKSAEYFAGTAIADEVIGPIISKIIQKTLNIVLIGMPGCGKTSIGKVLAAKTEREFADTDEWIAKTIGKSVSDIIEQDGEEVFRKLETEALKTLCKRGGLVIAAGGGIVTRPENKNIIRQNGIVIYLNRDIDELPTFGRPISERDGVKALASVRLPLYEQWSDEKIAVRGIEQTANEILTNRMIFCS
jgi:shikimate dehydrogenase